MNTISIMKRWQAHLQSVLKEQHLYQTRALALFSFAAAGARHCHLSRLCAHAPSSAQPHSTRRRLLRLLGNSRFHVSSTCWQLACWLQRWNDPSCRLLLLLDETPLRNDWRVLKVSVAFRRRALPLLWRVEPLRDRHQSMPECVLDLLQETAQLVAHYAPQAQVVLLADRGLCWPQVLRWCQGAHWDYVLRAQHAVRLRRLDAHGQWYPQPLHELAPRPGTWWCGQGQVFPKAGWLSSNVVAAWPAGCGEAWLLLTSLPPSLHCCRWYARRLWQEQSFRDEKSHGFNWQQSQVGCRLQDPQRVSRLLLILALAQLWLLSLGLAAQRPPWRRQLGLSSRATRRLWSLFRQGWHFLQWMRLQKRSLPHAFPCHLDLAPP